MSGVEREEDAARPRWKRRLFGLAVSAMVAGVPAALAWRQRHAPSLAPTPWGRRSRLSWRGGDLLVEQLGSGPPLLLLHSLGPGHHGREWRETAERLASRYRVVVPDLPGFGASPPAPVSVSGETYVDLLVELLAEHLHRPAVVVGAGISAAYALAARERAPERVRALGLVAPRGLRDRHLARGASSPATAALGKPLVGHAALALLTTRAAVRRYLERDVFARPERVDAERLDAYWRAARQPTAVRALVAYHRGDLDLDLADRPLAAEGPVWLAWGRRAATPPVEHADIWLQRLPGARLEIFEQAGALPHAEQPGRFAGRLAGFVESLPAD